MWHNLCGEEFAIGSTKYMLFFGKLALQHGVPSRTPKLSGK